LRISSAAAKGDPEFEDDASSSLGTPEKRRRALGGGPSLTFAAGAYIAFGALILLLFGPAAAILRGA